MTALWRPWQARILVWLPAVLLFIFSLAVYLWQSSGLAGRETGLRQSIAELETEVARLESIRQQAASERAQVVELDQQFSHLYQEVFGSLDDRLTQILRAVGGATREAGLLPGTGPALNADALRLFLLPDWPRIRPDKPARQPHKLIRFCTANGWKVGPRRCIPEQLKTCRTIAGWF